MEKGKQLLNRDTLKICFEQNTYINEIFKWEDPNIIAEILFSELNVIINAIAPKKRIQLIKKHTPFINIELRGKIIEKNKLLK